MTTDVVHVAAGARNDLLSVPEGDYVRLTVSDLACGISPETRPRIFDQFFKMKSTGRGIGLAAVHGVVRWLEGTIHVESAPGAGSTFEVLLPSISAFETLAAGASGAGSGRAA